VSKLGASVMNSGPEDLQTNTGETLQDTADVLSGYLDALVLRTADEARNKIHGNDLYA
jgi:ornithine carbamoyltransferase